MHDANVRDLTAHMKPPSQKPSNATEAAESLLDLGYVPIRLLPGTRKALDGGWQRTTAEVARANLDAFDGHNVGILIGRAGGNLIDIDLETPEARAVAPHLLPEGGAWCGRDGDGHCLYESLGTLPPDAAVSLPGVEVRWGKQQTAVWGQLEASPEKGKPACHLFPPTHWPRSADLNALLTAAADVSLATEVLRWWSTGSRHQLVLPLAGALIPRIGKDRTVRVVRAVCLVSGDLELHDRLRAVKDTARRLLAGETATGLGTLADMGFERLSSFIKKHLPSPQGSGTGSSPVEIIVVGADGPALSGLVDYDPSEPPKTALPQALAGGLLYRTGTHLLNAVSGAGKSTLCLQLSLCLAHGIPFLGLDVPQPLKVLYLNYEMPAGRIYQMLETVSRLIGKRGEKFPSGGRLTFLHHPNFQLNEDACNTLAAFARQEGYDLIIADTLSHALAPRDENDNSEAAQHMNRLSRLAREANAAVLISHHIGEAQHSNSPAYLGRGCSAWGANANVVLNLIRKTPSEFTLAIGKSHFADQAEFVIQHANLGLGFCRQYEFRALSDDARALAEALCEHPFLRLAEAAELLGETDHRRRRTRNAFEELSSHPNLRWFLREFRGERNAVTYAVNDITLQVIDGSGTSTERQFRFSEALSW